MDTVQYINLNGSIFWGVGFGCDSAYEDTLNGSAYKCSKVGDADFRHLKVDSMYVDDENGRCFPAEVNPNFYGNLNRD